MVVTLPGLGGKKEKANWLLRFLILVSVGIHLVIFIHISGLYESKVLNYIELTLQSVSKETPRTIPRPRQRPSPPKPQDVKRVKINPRPIPPLKPLKLEPARADAPDTLVEPIVMPAVPSTPSLSIEQWSPELIEDTSDEFVTPASYLEMVRLKIERHKKYPETATAKRVQGRVRVKFVITLEGGIREPRIAESSQHTALDEAALQAVKSAAPFPKPPRSLFKGEIPLVITVVFELI
jgi:protein TonB